MRRVVVVWLCLVLAACGGQEPAASTPVGAAPTAAAASTSRPTPVPALPTASPSTRPTTAPSATALAAPTVVTATATAAPAAAPAAASAGYSYPIALEGGAPGDGFFIGHGYGVENTWFAPGHWHAGEDWYALEGDAAGAQVLAVGAGEVVYVGGNYPGLVVIVRHDDGLFSMYGHITAQAEIREGRRVERGALLGRVAERGDDVPNHLHFEMRTFLVAAAVNGSSPRHGYRCGRSCPPGPGYWPIGAAEHPSAMGWRNPTHAIGRQANGAAIVATRPASDSVTLWEQPPGAGGQQRRVGELRLEPGTRFPVLEHLAGAADSRATSAWGYQLWYRIALPDGRSGWLQAAVPSARERGSDGRPSSILFNLLPAGQ